RLRTGGCMLGKIVVDGQAIAFDDPNKRNLVAAVSEDGKQIYPGKGKTVVVVDCGAKGSIIEELRAVDLTVIRVPLDYDFLLDEFDAVLVSNGPGDPSACHATIHNLEKALRLSRPV